MMLGRLLNAGFVSQARELAALFEHDSPDLTIVLVSCIVTCISAVVTHVESLEVSTQGSGGALLGVWSFFVLADYVLINPAKALLHMVHHRESLSEPMYKKNNKCYHHAVVYTVEPLCCGHLGEVSCIERCPNFRGKLL